MSAEESINEAVSASASIKSAFTDGESNRNRADSAAASVTSRQLENYDEEDVIEEEQDDVGVEQQHGQGAHVEYILVAEFEVDQGPLMEHQYPNAISGDEQ